MDEFPEASNGISVVRISCMNIGRPTVWRIVFFFTNIFSRAVVTHIVSWTPPHPHKICAKKLKQTKLFQLEVSVCLTMCIKEKHKFQTVLHKQSHPGVCALKILFSTHFDENTQILKLSPVLTHQHPTS